MKNMLLFGTILSAPEGLSPIEFKKFCDDWIKPYLHTIYHFPEFKFFVYISGIIFKYLEKNAKECIDVLHEIAARNQIEILNGMFYDAAPTLQYMKDAKEQLELLSHFHSTHKLGKVSSKGVWITSGTYENNTISLICEHGNKFLVIDRAYLEPVPAQYEMAIVESFGKKLIVFPFETLTLGRLDDDAFPQNLSNILTLKNTGKSCVFLSKFDPNENNKEYFIKLHKLLQQLRGLQLEKYAVLPANYINSDFSFNKVCRVRSSPYGVDYSESFNYYIQLRIESRLLYSRYLHITKLVQQHKGDKDRKTSAQQSIRKLQSHFYYWWSNSKWGIQNNRLRQFAYQSLGAIEKSLKTPQNKKIKVPTSIIKNDFDLDGNLEVVVSSQNMLSVIETQYGAIEFLQRNARIWNYLSCYVPYNKPKYPAATFRETILPKDINMTNIHTQILSNKQLYAPIEYKDYSHNNTRSSIICSSDSKNPLNVEKQYIFANNAIQVQCRLSNTSTSNVEENLEFCFMTEINLSFLSTNQESFTIEINDSQVSTTEVVHTMGQNITLYNYDNKEKIVISFPEKITIILSPIYGTSDIEASSQMYQYHSILLFCPYTLSPDSYESFDVLLNFSPAHRPRKK